MEKKNLNKIYGTWAKVKETHKDPIILVRTIDHYTTCNQDAQRVSEILKGKDENDFSTFEDEDGALYLQFKENLIDEYITKFIKAGGKNRTLRLCRGNQTQTKNNTRRREK